MTDLVNIFANLVDCHGNIKIPGIMDSVKAVTEEEKKIYETIDFDVVRRQFFCNVFEISLDITFIVIVLTFFTPVVFL